MSSEWIESKLSLSADQIEAHFKELISAHNCGGQHIQQDFQFLEKWIKRQPSGKQIDSDLLVLRTLETLILMAIVDFQRAPEEVNEQHNLFKQLEGRLMDWSEAAGLIRSFSDNQLSLPPDTSMDIDFNPNSETSALFALKPNEFDIYLLQKFDEKGMLRKYKEIVEIVADRCGIPIDSDFDEQQLPVTKVTRQKQQFLKEEQPVKHVSDYKQFIILIHKSNLSVRLCSGDGLNR